ncbi:DUF2716 domain-containing protein [Actinoplanes sp. HUAS TT8]|uniref:DUF2716 domain-containing protein n=1 Tax=Actinoplanes sp. HUAS TT8 TaxID=3447453 RepID=UPI003F528E57
MSEDCWIDLDWEVGKILWNDFAARFHFRAGTTQSNWPAIVEPAPSITWDLSPIFEGDCPGGFTAGMIAVAGLVLGTLQDCTDWYEAVAFHDAVHPSALFRAHQADEPQDVPGWDTGGLFPNGDYTIFVGRDQAFGIVGHPWEQSLCVFGAAAVNAFTTRNVTVLDATLRRRSEP